MFLIKIDKVSVFPHFWTTDYREKYTRIQRKTELNTNTHTPTLRN